MAGESTSTCPFGKRGRKKEGYLKRARKKGKAVSARHVARTADRGEDISRFFTNRLRMIYPIQRVNVDFTAPMLAVLQRN
jgi:hypothetical protein